MLDQLDKVVATYNTQGFVAGLPALSLAEVEEMRAYIEWLEAQHAAGAGGHSLAQFFRVNGHVVIPALAQVARHPAILAPVEAILGPGLRKLYKRENRILTTFSLRTSFLILETIA